MVREQIVSLGKLESLIGKPAKRNTYLKSCLGLTNEDLAEIRSGPLEDRIKKAALAVYTATGDRTHITFYTVAALAYDRWDSGVHGQNLGRVFRGVYGQESAEFAKRGVKIPLVEFLRAEVTGQKIPLVKEMRVWEGIEPSNADFLRSVKIPTDTKTRKVSQVVGYIFGDGILNVQKKDDRNVLVMSGNKDDWPFYKQVLKPTLETTFNIPLPVDVSNHSGEFLGKERDYDDPSIQIGSKAVVSWAMNDLGLPLGKTNVKLPVELCDRQGLLEGLLATMGNKYQKHKTSSNFVVIDHDKDFIGEVYDLSREVGYKPSEPRHQARPEIGFSQGSWRLEYGWQDVQQMKFINPKHLT